MQNTVLIMNGLQHGFIDLRDKMFVKCNHYSFLLHSLILGPKLTLIGYCLWLGIDLKLIRGCPPMA